MLGSANTVLNRAREYIRPAASAQCICLGGAGQGRRLGSADPEWPSCRVRTTSLLLLTGAGISGELLMIVLAIALDTRVYVRTRTAGNDGIAWQSPQLYIYSQLALAC
jgi:hypothetical protein